MDLANVTLLYVRSTTEVLTLASDNIHDWTPQSDQILHSGYTNQFFLN